jgi:nicotinamide mononucleotide (NMN) deamidase PncC
MARGGAGKPGIRWVRPPSELARAVERYGERVLQAVAAVAQYTATAMQNGAKANAAWTDRTGNARTGLFGTSEADFGAKVVTIYLSHGALIDYGVWLELANSGRYAIIMRTMQAHYEPLMQMLRDIFA